MTLATPGRSANEQCAHEPNAGMCYVCAPWMFPTPERVAAAGKALAEWRQGFPGAHLDIEETPALPVEIRVFNSVKRRTSRAKKVGREIHSVSRDEMTLVRMLRAKAKQMGVSVAMLSMATRAEVMRQVKQVQERAS